MYLDSSDSIRYLDLALARFGSTVDGSGMVRKFPLLYQKFKLLKRHGRPEAAEAARTLLRTLDEEGFRVSAEVAAVYREALSEYVSSAVQAKDPAFFIDAELMKSLPARLEKAASSVSSEFLVSRPHAGDIVLLQRDADGDGRSDGRSTLLSDLRRPLGLDLHGGWLYIAESNRIARIAFDDATGTVSGDYEVIVDGLTDDGNHWSKTLR